MACSAKQVRAVTGSLGALVVALALGLPEAARADPCRAIPDHGALPSYLAPGSSFTGPVVYVGDGDSLCVGTGLGGSNWVEVRLADFYAPELSSPDGPAAKRALEHLAMRREVSCVAQHQSYDRIVARCELDGRSLGDLLRGGGGSEGGNGYSGVSPSFAPPSAAELSNGVSNLDLRQGAWILPLAAASAAAAVGVLYVGFRPARVPRKAGRRGGKMRRRR